MNSNIKFEHNSLRRSHRFRIPIFIVINDRSYRVLDWSLFGLAVEDLMDDLKVGDRIDAMLSLPMMESTLNIKVELSLQYIKKNRYGFSYKTISQKNKKVLRRYLEMAIEGGSDDANNILSIYNEPDIVTPVNAPIKLDDKEHEKLSKEFRSFSWKYLLFSALFFATLAGVVYYNLKYSFKTMGVIKGNEYKIYPYKMGKIDKIYVKEDQKVKKGDPLVQMDVTDILYKLDLLESEKKRIVALSDEIKKGRSLNSPKNSYIKALKSKLRSKKKIYDDAKKQFKQKLITLAEFQKIKDDYLDSKIRLAKSLEDMDIKPLSYTLDTSDIDIKLAHAKRELSLSRINSISDATVYEIYKKEGEIVSTKSPIMTLWTKEKPHIEVSIPNDKLSQISMDTKVEIVNPLTNETIDAKIYKIGSSDEQKDLSFATVFLRTKKVLDGLKPHQRVHVFFKRGWF